MQWFTLKNIVDVTNKHFSEYDIEIQLNYENIDTT